MFKKSFYGLVVCLSMLAVVLCAGVASAAPGDACNLDADCDDTLFCTGVESCSTETSLCLDSTGDPCAEGETCNDDTDTCDAAPECVMDADCDDAIFCNGAEECIEGACEAGDDPCEEGETCDEVDLCVAEADCPEIDGIDEDGNCLLSKDELKAYSTAQKARHKDEKNDLKVTQKADKEYLKYLKDEYGE